MKNIFVIIDHICLGQITMFNMCNIIRGTLAVYFSVHFVFFFLTKNVFELVLQRCDCFAFDNVFGRWKRSENLLLWPMGKNRIFLMFKKDDVSRRVKKHYRKMIKIPINLSFSKPVLVVYTQRRTNKGWFIRSGPSLLVTHIILEYDKYFI